jgi:hypothetical protein
MKTVKFSGLSENAYGKAIPPLKYEASFEAFENIDEVRAANAVPKDSDLVKMINRALKATARQAAMVAAWTAAGIIKPTLENDEQLRLKSMAKIFIAAGKSKSEARTLASASLGIEWADDDDDDTE